LQLKINATNDFNAGAVIATLKRQLLVYKHIVQCIDRCLDLSTSFCTAYPFTQPQNSTLYNARHPKSAASHGDIYTPCHTCFLDPPDRFRGFCTAHGRESLYFTVCVKMQWMRD